MIFGFVILNDWRRATSSNGNTCRSGRSRPRRSATSISPWVVTREALEPFRVHGPAQEPTPLAYLAAGAAEQLRYGSSRSACARRQ